jgi:hypothetical protein
MSKYNKQIILEATLSNTLIILDISIMSSPIHQGIYFKNKLHTYFPTHNSPPFYFFFLVSDCYIIYQ